MRALPRADVGSAVSFREAWSSHADDWRGQRLLRLNLCDLSKREAALAKAPVSPTGIDNP